MSILLRKIDTALIRSDLLTKLKFGAGLVTGRDSLLGITLEMANQILTTMPTLPPTVASSFSVIPPSVISDFLSSFTPSFSSIAGGKFVNVILRSGNSTSTSSNGTGVGVSSVVAAPVVVVDPLVADALPEDPVASDSSSSVSLDSDVTASTDTPAPVQPQHFPPIPFSTFLHPYAKSPNWLLPQVPTPAGPGTRIPLRWSPAWDTLSHTLHSFLSDQPSSAVVDPAFLAYQFEYSRCFSTPRYPVPPQQIYPVTFELADTVRANARRSEYLPPVWFRSVLHSRFIPGLKIPYNMLFDHSGVRCVPHFPIPFDLSAPMFLLLEINRHEAQRILVPGGLHRRNHGYNVLTLDRTDFTPATHTRLDTIFELFTGSRWVHQRLFDDPDWQTAYSDIDHFADLSRDPTRQSNADRRLAHFELLRAMQQYHVLHPGQDFALTPDAYPHWFDYFLAGCHTHRARKLIQLTMQVIYRFRLHMVEFVPRPSTIACVNLLRMFDRALQSDWCQTNPDHQVNWVTWIRFRG